jgi:hypothetical protein
LISNVNFTTGTIVIAGQGGTSASAGVKPYYFSSPCLKSKNIWQ